MIAADLNDPDLYTDGVPHDAFRRLREEGPVHWHPLGCDGDGFWAVVRQADVVAVGRDPATFSSAVGFVGLENLDERVMELRRSMIETDPPDHTRLRRAGQLRRFLHEMAIDDIVVYPARQDWTYRIGRVIGDYFYAAGEPFPHRRPITWLKTVSRDVLSRTARFELGSAMSLFNVKRHAQEILDLLDGQRSARPTTDEVEEANVDLVTAIQVEEATREFVLDQLRQHYAGHELERFVADLLEAMGYRAQATKKSGDHGIDVIAGRGPLGLDLPTLKVQVKSGRTPVGEPPIIQLNGSVEQGQGERGLVVSLGGFTVPALRWAEGRSTFKLIDPGDLVDLIVAHYEGLAPEHREKIPLRRVYAPERPGGL